MTATDRTPPPLKWLCLGNRDANDGFELFAHGIYARNGALVGADAVDEALDQRRGLLFAPDEMDIAGVQAGYRFT